MQKLPLITILLTLILSCGESDKKAQDTAKGTSEITTQSEEKTTAKSADNTTLLCKINGEDWGYTSADGLVSRNSSTNLRTATITFVRKLAEGSESVQLEYDVDGNTLTRVLAELKRPDKDGNLFTNFYNQSANQLDRNPEASMSGTVSLNEGERIAAGTAVFKVQNDFEKDKLGNASDLLITISDLKFSGVPYSDTDDLKNMFKK
ncbi:hypothetical protein [uncultured Maribacter sp.]|uniref:hypothetical protein n=1 Tax=uncultured Maribacter sp. TaxID=431308 RepID=UPI0030D8619F|tara:strand:+ start:3400 stop:4017 length:618 start_codon:yes stop_codon:yes gene_type:complete